MQFDHYKILFFGSSEFALPTLAALLKNRWKIVAVITQPDRPKGREGQLASTPVKDFAVKKRLRVLEYPNFREPDAIETLKSLQPDFAVVAAYGSLIPAAALKLTRLGFLNIHPSALPKYRGPSPIQSALLNGEEKIGISIMLLDEQMDHGPILAQKEISIEPEEDYTALQTRLSSDAADFLLGTLPQWLLGEIQPKPQDEKKATFTKILTRDDGKINWKNSARAILLQIRALAPWPGTWTTFEGERLKILRAKISDSILTSPPGHIYASAKQLFVSCGNGTALEILQLQPAGKNPMSTEDYLHGHSGVAGKVFQD